MSRADRRAVVVLACVGLGLWLLYVTLPANGWAEPVNAPWRYRLAIWSLATGTRLAESANGFPTKALCRVAMAEEVAALSATPGVRVAAMGCFPDGVSA